MSEPKRKVKVTAGKKVQEDDYTEDSQYEPYHLEVEVEEWVDEEDERPAFDACMRAEQEAADALQKGLVKRKARMTMDDAEFDPDEESPESEEDVDVAPWDQ